MSGRRIPARWRLACCLGGLAVALLTSGCGPRFGNVSGTVTIKNKPVSGGTITFYDADNHAVGGEIKADGSFTVNKVKAGRARVTVVAPMAIEFKGIGGGEAALPGAPKPSPVPARYADPENSGLTLEVTEGDQTHDFPLEG
jgi:hypothetical protein